MYTTNGPCAVCEGYINQLRKEKYADLDSDLSVDLDELSLRFIEMGSAHDASVLRALHLSRCSAQHCMAMMYRRKAAPSSIEELVKKHDAANMFKDFLSIEHIDEALKVLNDSYAEKELDGINAQLTMSRVGTAQMLASSFERTRTGYYAVCDLLGEMKAILRGSYQRTLSAFGKHAATTLLQFIDVDDAIKVGKQLLVINQSNGVVCSQ